MDLAEDDMEESPLFPRVGGRGATVEYSCRLQGSVRGEGVLLLNLKDLSEPDAG